MSAVTPYRIATIEGDGIGPEVTQGAMRVLTEACGAGVLDFVMLEGGAGADELLGQLGDDVITGSAWSDLIYGGEGNDFINGGFGSDRVNGGTGADRFYHLGIPDHGSDWIQDYTSTEGDSLLWGGGPDSPQNFQVNFAETPNAGTSGVAEAFVIYLPTDQIIWALVDGAAQDQINIRIAGNVFDLMG